MTVTAEQPCTLGLTYVMNVDQSFARFAERLHT